MGRKKILRIAKTAKIKCNICSALSIRKVPEDSSPGYFDCDKCSAHITVPVTQCCVICAFTKKKCVPSLKMEARIKGLELR
ncbi:MAG: hypothetical protein Q7R87_04355 [Nanoarchaeota archaeon]|nr:hypothetical protein [Nanoarchaeota archaeon]